HPRPLVPLALLWQLPAHPELHDLGTGPAGPTGEVLGVGSIRTLLAALLLFVAAPVSVAQSWPGAGMPPFPALSGPVVDEAHLLPGEVLEQLSRKLATYAQDNGTQVVVVTLPTLKGYPLEDYGYQLGRHWGIGQKGKNNGVLLIVDAGEKQMRIEVGYGLEGTLTDA